MDGISEGALTTWAKQEEQEGEHKAGNPSALEALAELGRMRVKEALDEFDRDALDADALDWADTFDPEVDENPPEWVADEAKWAKAKAIAEDAEQDGEIDDKWAFVAHLYLDVLKGEKA